MQTIRLLTWLKVFQRLGYFPAAKEISFRIIKTYCSICWYGGEPEIFVGYDCSRLKWVHHATVREFLGVTAYAETARKTAVAASLEAATTRDDLVDIINVAIEELLRQRYELLASAVLRRSRIDHLDTKSSPKLFDNNAKLDRKRLSSSKVF